MTKLWQYTEAQAEAMSAANAVKVLAEQEKKHEEEDDDEAADRELEGYALEYDETGERMKDSSGNYVAVKEGHDIPDAGDIWRHLSKIYSQNEMMKITVAEAESLHPKVKEILEKKVADTIGKFKEQASEKTRAKYEKGTQPVKDAILRNWLKSHGHASFDGGRRTRRGPRRSRKTRSTRALTARRHV